MNDLSQAIHDLPLRGIIPVGLLVVTGLMLWAAGRRILRAGFAVIGLMIGGVIGFMMGESMDIGISPWVIAIISGALLACVSAMAFRVAIAVAMAAVFAMASPLCVISVAQAKAHRSGHVLADGEAHNAIGDKIDEWWNKPESDAVREKAERAANATTQAIKEQLDSAKDALAEPLGDKGLQQIERFEEYRRKVSNYATQQWEKTPKTLRPTLILAATIGGVVGLLIGIIGPLFSAAIITAMGGSLLWLTGTRILLARMGMSEVPWIPTSGSGWLILWFITSVVGLGIQWTFRRRSADKAPG